MFTYKSKTSGLVLLADPEMLTEEDQARIIADAYDEEARSEIEYAFRAMLQRERRWNQLVTPDQARIGSGDFFRAVVRVPMSPEMTVWGEVLTVETIEDSERLRGASEQEIMRWAQNTRQRAAAGWRWTRSYSLYEPDGEYGAWHVSHLTRISAGEFAAAKIRRWRP
jgi:hypothetical protein